MPPDCTAIRARALDATLSALALAVDARESAELRSLLARSTLAAKLDQGLPPAEIVASEVEAEKEAVALAEAEGRVRAITDRLLAIHAQSLPANSQAA